MAEKIIALFPRHVGYIEPFGGSAAVLLSKPPSKFEIYNENADLKRLLELTPYSRRELDFAFDAEPVEDPVETARRTIVRSFMGFGSASGTRKHKTGFRCPVTDGRHVPSHEWSNYSEALPEFEARLRRVVIENCGAIELIDRFDAETTMIYLDPPYVHSTRGST